MSKPKFELEVEEEVIPNPGSDEAIEMGCECPRIDNNYGSGYMGNPDIFITNQACLIHGDDG